MIQHLFTRMTEGRMAQIMPQRDRLCQVFVQPERSGDRAGDLCDLQRMRESCPVVIARRRQKDLRLVLQSPERLGMQDPVPVSLIDRADLARRFIFVSSETVLCMGSIRAQIPELPLLQLFPYVHIFSVSQESTSR